MSNEITISEQHKNLLPGQAPSMVKSSWHRPIITRIGMKETMAYVKLNPVTSFHHGNSGNTGNDLTVTVQ
jgi:hypothetical protein